VICCGTFSPVAHAIIHRCCDFRLTCPTPLLQFEHLIVLLRCISLSLRFISLARNPFIASIYTPYIIFPMASTTKYQPAPQRDSLDEPQTYTQAPPSYQTAGPSTNDGGYETPRSEDDNVPDDFKVSSIPSEFSDFQGLF